jgi:hypothetical protein
MKPSRDERNRTKGSLRNYRRRDSAEVALQAEGVDCSAKIIRIARTFSEDGTLDRPKSGHGRRIEMSRFLADVQTEEAEVWMG